MGSAGSARSASFGMARSAGLARLMARAMVRAPVAHPMVMVNP